MDKQINIWKDILNRWKIRLNRWKDRQIEYIERQTFKKMDSQVDEIIDLYVNKNDQIVGSLFTFEQ